MCVQYLQASDLRRGCCWVQRRQTWIVDESKAIFHTMISSSPDTVAPAPAPALADPMEMEQMALELFPSPSRLASTSKQNSPEPEIPDSHTYQVSSLFVGTSTCSEGQPPLVMQQGDLKASGKVTAQNYQIMSDRRLKGEILPLDIDAVAILAQLEIVQYKLKTDAHERPQIGVVAQDVATVWPGAVEDDSTTGLKSVRLDLLYFIAMRALQDFLPLLTELDKQRRLGLPLLMHAQQQAVAQQATNPCQESLPARMPCSNNLSDSESECETHMSVVGNLSMQHSSDSSGCHSKDDQSSSSSAPPSFKDDAAAMVAHMLAALKEDNGGMPFIVRKLLKKLGKEAVWSTFLESQYTRLPAADGKARSPGSTFLHLLKKQEQQAKIV